jgi:hypothetical protein
MVMRKWFAIVMAWMVVASFLAGCADMAKMAQVKCAGCEQVFDVYEGPRAGNDK